MLAFLGKYSLKIGFNRSLILLIGQKNLRCVIFLYNFSIINASNIYCISIKSKFIYKKYIIFFTLTPNTMETNKLGSRLKAARERLHLTQGELAEILEIHQGNLSRIESNTNNLTLGIVKKLAVKLDLNPNYLLGLDDKLKLSEEKDVANEPAEHYGNNNEFIKLRNENYELKEKVLILRTEILELKTELLKKGN